MKKRVYTIKLTRAEAELILRRISLLNQIYSDQASPDPVDELLRKIGKEIKDG